MNQDQQKQAIAAAALSYVLANTNRPEPIGIGTGSTANCFIDLLGAHRERFTGGVPSSDASAERLQKAGIPVLTLAESGLMSFYVDGADEIDPRLCMIKGGGAALTREKIVASMAEQFICIADASKRVDCLGAFPLPIEVIPMAEVPVTLTLQKLGGVPKTRPGVITDNGNLIIDVAGLEIADPCLWEQTINQIPGVVTNGIFALQSASLLMTWDGEGVIQVGPIA
jgi:ribose 5-phosphate isomerase A